MLDAVPGGFAHTVEGFLGVYDPMGILSVIASGEAVAGVWQFDHAQIATCAPVPLPAGIILLMSGLAGLFGSSSLRGKSSIRSRDPK